MSWRDTLGPASFRRVEFFVSTNERVGGRRGQTHEYPFRDEPFREDTGRKARGFSVEGYVIGSNYFPERDALIAALESKGVGELRHPYFGTRRVAVESFRVRESADRGGMATFSIEFVETPAQPIQPAALTDAPGKLRSSGATTKAAVGAEFSSRFSTDGEPAWTLPALSAVVRNATARVSALVIPTLSDAQDAAALRRDLDQLGLAATELLASPADLLEQLSTGFVTFDFPLTRAGLRALISAYGFDPGTRPPATTSTRERQQENFDAIHLLTQRLILVQAALSTLDQVWESYNDALQTRNLITDLLDEQAEDAADDTFSVLQQLRADLVKAVPGEEGDLPRLLTHTPGVTVPSLTLAQKLYGNVDLESDLVTRNRIRNPLLVPGGRELEVLSRG